MYMSKKKFEEIRANHDMLLIVNSDVIDSLRFVQEILEAEADALKEKEPTAVNTIERLNVAAYEVFDLIGQIEYEQFGGPDDEHQKVH